MAGPVGRSFESRAKSGSRDVSQNFRYSDFIGIHFVENFMAIKYVPLVDGSKININRVIRILRLPT